MDRSSSSGGVPPLPYNPHELPRETKRHYISASQAEIASMLEAVGAQSFEDLYRHLSEGVRLGGNTLPQELGYDALQREMAAIASQNRPAMSFTGDGLADFTVPEITQYVAGIRNLTTAYTPYQPELGQGTLVAHWIYQCQMARLTGFEAVSSSLYERSTALYEACLVALRLQRGSDTVLLSEGLYPGDLEVVRTLSEGTPLTIETVPLDPETGLTDRKAALARAQVLGKRLAAVAFPQVNCLGLLEDADGWTDAIAGTGARSIGVVDPLLLAGGGLKPPNEYGENGCDMIVGEAQHLALRPNFGGPGLGLFAIRYNEKSKSGVRQTPGRYVGTASDVEGRACRVMVLSTREQHIRKDKATSNICSNQAFLATMAGAALTARGDEGLRAMIATARERAVEAVEKLTALKGVKLAYEGAPFFNEVTFELPAVVAAVLESAREAGLHAGVDVSPRVGDGERRLLKLSFHDGEQDVDRLAEVIGKAIGNSERQEAARVPEIPAALKRTDDPGLLRVGEKELQAYYDRLGELNVSPDNGCYPLGSCTMKYNPFINDWAAGLEGFAGSHPQAPLEDVQGNLRVLFEIQEAFTAITGLPAVTTQPVAGAQGELVGLKLFQAYHRDRGEEEQRDILLIPKSAHGTNFATAAMAGFSKGIVHLQADAKGCIDYNDFCAKLEEYGNRIAGVMITNPNTTGLFETRFADIAAKTHDIGGLVYMDGANMNAVAGWVDLEKLGVDAVHQNLHKTWTIPHGGGGPGDAVVAVSARLRDYLPGLQVVKRTDGTFGVERPAKSIGSFHRHWGNFAHKVRALTYIKRLGREGVPAMAATAVLSARYLFERLKPHTDVLPKGTESEPRMHEFILTLRADDFARIDKTGLSKQEAIIQLGKLFLDFGFHAPTMAWPEPLGLMIEPTESFSKEELDRFADAVVAILTLVRERPEVLARAPYFTPVGRINEVEANRAPTLSEAMESLPALNEPTVSVEELSQLPLEEIAAKVLEASRQESTTSESVPA